MRYNYQLHHVIIAQAMTVILSYVGIGGWSFVFPALFYFIRECIQYYNGKRHKGAFDYGGFLPVWLSQFLMYLL